jgi:toxin YoeB
MKSVLFEKTAFDDLKYWGSTDLKIVKKIIELIDDIQKHPFTGIGKPEPLKHQLKGYWSRRITDEHRLIYTVTDQSIFIAACRYHY